MKKRMLALFTALVIVLNSGFVFANTSGSKEIEDALTKIYNVLLKADREDAKITDKDVQVLAQRKINEIRATIEMAEERYGGLLPHEYKEIALQLVDNLYRNQETMRTKASVYIDEGLIKMNFDLKYSFDNIGGKFSTIGIEKDQIDSETYLKVQGKVKHYLEQATRMGYQIDSSIAKELPAAVENMVTTEGLTKIVLARTMEDIYETIIRQIFVKFDGSDSLEDIIDNFLINISINQSSREREIPYEYYQYPKDSPSTYIAQERITSMLVNEEIPVDFNSDFNKPVTRDQLARLYFENLKYTDKEDLDKIILEEGLFDETQPPYIKYAFIYGLIDNVEDLDKPMTRLEAGRILTKFRNERNSSLNLGRDISLPIYDYHKIAYSDMWTVSNALNVMGKKGLNFDPISTYTREEAILDRYTYREGDANLRGLIPGRAGYYDQIIIGKNTFDFRFDSRELLEKYMRFNFEDLYYVLDMNGKYQRIDLGYALLELYTKDMGIKFTIKEGVDYIGFEDGVYGPELQYHIEPRVLAAGENLDMTMKPDPITTEVYKKLDGMLAKIIRQDMTDEQKVKAIHDFVVKHITYDSQAMSRIQDFKSIRTPIDKGRGVCVDYSLMFKYLCLRASIPCIMETGNVSFTSIGHAWNVVYVNGSWKFVDSTFADQEKKGISYQYYLKDRLALIGSHGVTMGNPAIEYFPEVDAMKIKSQDELKVFVSRNSHYKDLTFRMADKNMKPNMGFIKFDRWITSYDLKYDGKNDLYSLKIK